MRSKMGIVNWEMKLLRSSCAGQYFFGDDVVGVVHVGVIVIVTVRQWLSAAGARAAAAGDLAGD